MLVLWGCPLVNNYEGPLGRPALRSRGHVGNILLSLLQSRLREKLFPCSSQKLLCGSQAHPAACMFTKPTGNQEAASGPSAHSCEGPEIPGSYCFCGPFEGWKPATTLSKTKTHRWFLLFPPTPWGWAGKGAGILHMQMKLLKLSLLPL